MPYLRRSAGEAVLSGKWSVVVRIAYGAKDSGQRRDSQNQEEDALVLALLKTREDF